jgi:aspartyl aminopeptidase
MAMHNNFLSTLCSHLDISPTPLHAVETVAKTLDQIGFERVDFKENFAANPGPYYVVAGGSIVAWIQPKKISRFRIVGAHTDSPNLRLRPSPEYDMGGFKQLSIEPYGTPLFNSWLDRDLGLAGRVTIKSGATDSRVEQKLMLLDEPILRIPQLAIHLDREIRANGLKLDPQHNLNLVWGGSDEFVMGYGSFKTFLSERVSCKESDILGWDLMTFDIQKATLTGFTKNFLSSGRIDNLVSVFAASEAMVELDAGSLRDGTMPVFVGFDHEEVGSQTAVGAASSFLSKILERSGLAAGLSRPDYLTALANSYMISSDCAHATNPNYMEKHDFLHLIALNKGVVIKQNQNQHYASNANNVSFLLSLFEDATMKFQYYSNRNDIPCGTTIGPLVAAQLAVSTVDIGPAQLSMHAARETVGCSDVVDLVDIFGHFWLS